MGAGVIRATRKFAICGVPISVDSYLGCEHKCTYCYSNNRKKMRRPSDDLLSSRPIPSEKLVKQLARAYSEKWKRDDPVDILLRAGVTLQFGGMSDPFPTVERELGVTAEYVRILDQYRQKVLFNTKADDLRGVPLDPSRHTVNVTITTMDEEAAALIEPGAPSPGERAAFVRRLAREGFRVGVRVQPWMPGFDVSAIIRETEGSVHYLVEGFKFSPGDVGGEEEQSEWLAGFPGLSLDVMESYRGQKVVRRDLRRANIERLMKDHPGVSISCSDNDLRQFSTDRCCCGDALVDSSGFDVTALLYDGCGSYTLEDQARAMEAVGFDRANMHHLGRGTMVKGWSVTDYIRRGKRTVAPDTYRDAPRQGELFGSGCDGCDVACPAAFGNGDEE